MKVFYSDHHVLELPEGHRFPEEKYALLRRGLVSRGILSSEELVEAPFATREHLLLAHDASYVDRFLNGTIPAVEMRRIGFPWSEALVRRVLGSVGGAQAAALEALRTGVSGNLAGGTHHAHHSFGSGYCVFNDLAVAALDLLENGLVRRVGIVDLDVHQGDGNAAILAGDSRVFVFNMHCEVNFPFRKVPSTFDIAVKAGTGDAEYLALLRENLDRLFAFGPEIVLYQAGVDPLAEDSLGKLNLTHAGLFNRDCFVLSECRRRGIPVSLALGGGYSRPIDATVEAYLGTYRAVREIFPALK